MPQRRPKTPSRRAKTAPRGAQDAPGLGKWSQNGAKLAPESFQMEGSLRKSENLSNHISLQRGLDFRGFEVRFSEVKSMDFRRFFREASQKRVQKPPRRPRTPPRRPETPPRRAQDAPRRPRSTARRPKTPPRRGPGRARSGINWAPFGIEMRSPADSPVKLDF